MMFQLQTFQNKAAKNDKYVKKSLFYYSFIIYEIQTKLLVYSFYFSFYPFRKPPEWDRKGWESII